MNRIGNISRKAATAETEGRSGDLLWYGTFTLRWIEARGLQAWPQWVAGAAPELDEPIPVDSAIFVRKGQLPELSLQNRARDSEWVPVAHLGGVGHTTSTTALRRVVHSTGHPGEAPLAPTCGEVGRRPSPDRSRT
jgi:hypothetical protein